MTEPPQLVARKLSKRFDQQIIFEDISFSLHPGDKVALLARNGTGKTTLIRCLMGLEKLDAGELEWASALRVGLVSQAPRLNPQDSVRAAVLDSEWPALQAIREFEAAQATQNTKALEQAYTRMEQLNAWDLQQEVQRVMSILRLDSLEQKVGQLSGGQRRRIALARALLESPDLLILDEPTNHLDLDMIEWLEQYLKRARQTLLLVTHDRYFLEAVCNSILELEQGQLKRYKGSFSDYLALKAEEAESDAQQEEADRNLYRKELAWARKQPRARGTKSKARMEAVDALGDKIAARTQAKDLEMDVNMQRLGKNILEIKNLSKSFDAPVIDNFSHLFSRGDRIGLIGRNGSGKSTFLNLLTGQLEPDRGSIRWGETVKFAYYQQQNLPLDPKMRVIDAVRDVAEYLPLKKGKTISASQLLERFLFSPTLQHRYIETLSGGEKRRLYLLTLLMTNPNFLILDEPTNDLDIPTLQVLEDFLMDYPGCLMVVSHDRYLMDKVVDHLFIFEGQGQIRYSPRSYTHWWEAQQEEQKLARQEKQNKAKQTEAKPVKKPTKLSWKEERELEALDDEMQALEAQKQSLTAQLAQPDQLSAGELQQLSEQFGEVQESLEEKELRWLELEEKRESFNAAQS